ncbi:MAG: HDIG domain-containing protein [candidate division WOR-3 bacterium]|nr:HDIG domain-containing protein [candidate division WOR-3 bacterium]MCX7947223.1 HDIG domain-containing protein [candidate division WOR-3 bacterium]MDW8150278.1 HDIG domain-containing protein [candidate division WOR-3 bacterium]
MKKIVNYIPFLVSAIVCSIFVPNPYSSIKLNQKSNIDIYAPYDIQVKKSASEIKAESLKVISEIYPVFIYEDYSIKNVLNSPLYEFLKEEIQKFAKVGIVSDEDYRFLQNDPAEKIAIYIQGELFEKNKNSILSFSMVYDTIISKLKLIYPDSIEKVKIFLLENIKSNLKFDSRLTNLNRESALKTIDIYKYKIKKGELIVKRDEIVDKEIFEKIKALYQNRNFVFSLLLIIPIFFIWASINFYKKDLSFQNVILLNFSITLFCIVHSFLITFGFSYTFNTLVFFSLLLSFLISKPVCINFATTSSIILGIYYNMDFLVFIWTLLVSIATILLSGMINRRYEIVIIAVIIIPVSIFFQGILRYQIPTLNEIIWITTSVSFSLLLAILMLLVLERFTRLTTKFNLLDIASLEHKLIEMLREKAPGTYNHSINVSILAQEAAEEVGADALLCKVGAYFHDIGKIKNPQYFVENQIGYNPHDELEPEESAKIIIEHVIEGVKLAKKYGLPNGIIDIIRTHHGNTILEPFYKKAIAKNPNIDKKIFQYPGPNPRNKEEGIVMLADAVEAAVRSLKEKDKESIKKIVKTILNTKWEGGYLENTDLKRKDLEKIEEVFIKVLDSIYHPRIAYD